MQRILRGVAAALALSMTASCAAILHPERKGNRGGSVDVVPLVVDILLFIPGLLPGLIAIIVDFGTGAIYTGGGSAQAHDVGRHGKIAIRARDLPEGSRMSLRLVDARGVVLDRDGTGADGEHGRLSVNLRHAARAHAEETEIPLTLELQVDDRPVTKVALLMK